MAGKVILELSVKDYKKLVDYLESHEWDIAVDINDFGDLRGIFVAVFDMEPKEG